MINIDFFNILVDWTMMVFQISFLSFQYPQDDMFRTDSLFALVLGKEFYFEFFFIVLIGEKTKE